LKRASANSEWIVFTVAKKIQTLSLETFAMLGPDQTR
jgi:hypothetical protein